MSNILYTYGTLRPGSDHIIIAQGQMFDLGWFPAVRLDLPGEFVCEPTEVKDWESVDRYEGYDPDNLKQSFYIRKPFLDGYIYEFNQDLSRYNRVVSGDWLQHMEQKRGINAEHFTRVH